MRAADGSLTGPGSPVMQGLIPLMLVFTLLPSLAYGIVAGTIRNHRQVIEAMATTMSSMGYYIVMVFFAAQFTKAFADSNLGALIALEGADTLRALAMPPAVTIVGIVLLTAAIDFLVPSASAKWALLAPILVPMLMSVGIAPEVTQAAFRVGDGPVNLMTPLMPYFPLVLTFCRRYVTGFGVGTLMSLLLPFGIVYLVAAGGHAAALVGARTAARDRRTLRLPLTRARRHGSSRNPATGAAVANGLPHKGVDNSELNNQCIGILTDTSVRALRDHEEHLPLLARRPPSVPRLPKGPRRMVKRPRLLGAATLALALSCPERVRPGTSHDAAQTAPDLPRAGEDRPRGRSRQDRSRLASRLCEGEVT